MAKTFEFNAIKLAACTYLFSYFNYTKLQMNNHKSNKTANELERMNEYEGRTKKNLNKINNLQKSQGNE